MERAQANAGRPFWLYEHSSSSWERNGLDNETETLATVLRQVVDHPALVSAEFNRSFVLMQYFGYLRRDPDQGGYDFWLGVLNQTNDQNGMVQAFVTSTEYRARFGQP